MWEFVNGVTGSYSRRPPKRAGKAHMLPAMLIGASVGIAAWEVVRRRVGTPTRRDTEHDDPILAASAE